MLVLSRKAHETIRIGSNIVIHVRRVRGDRVHLGVEAPRDVPVFRGEVADRIEEEQQSEGGGT
jgi:carbon storage regulator